MDVKYNIFASIKLTHQYFKDGVDHAFSLVPTMESAKSMKDYNIAANSGTDQLNLYVGQRGKHELNLKDHMAGLDQLTFYVVNKNPNFFNYSGVPFLDNNQLFYFKNSAEKEQLQSASFVGENDVMEYSTKVFNITPPESSVEIQVLDSQGNSIFSDQVDGTKVKNYLMNLSWVDNGVYQVQFDGQLYKKLYLMDRELDPGYLGIVEIGMSSLLSQAGETVSYQINFNTRSAVRQYKIIFTQGDNIEINEVSITPAEEEVYTGPEDEVVMSKQTAKVFTTTTALPQVDKAEAHPMLKMSYAQSFSGRMNEHEINLPNPGCESLISYQNGNDQTFLISSIVYV